jgi:glycosyltransferase involved in cell wall biosynthesis
MQLSVVIPCYNEEESLPALLQALDAALPGLERTYEVIIVDDGSTDGSYALLRAAARTRPWLRLVRLRRNFGQTAAMSAGFDRARGEVVVPMDADLQNDPADIGRLLAEIDEGFDVVSGWRKDRKDRALTRRLPSVMANWLIGRVTGVRIHDYGCTLKAYRREVLREVHLYGEMHRFLPALAAWAGARIGELVVTHHPRRAGVSKYGLGRTLKVLLDLLTVKFLGGWATKPIYVFGLLGLLLCALGMGAAGIVVVEKIYLPDAPAHRNPLLLLATFLFIIGMQSVMLGLLAEIGVRTYHESQHKPIYVVREEVEGEGASAPDVTPAAAAVAAGAAARGASGRKG